MSGGRVADGKLRELLSGAEAITFDCYGTLIDWETGILAALTPFLQRWGLDFTRRDVLSRYATFEREEQRGAEGASFVPYREVLARVLERFAEECGAAVGCGDRCALADSIGQWPAFEETPAALRALGRHARLGVVSNIDDDLFAQTRPKLGVDLEETVTAEQVRSYKPRRNHFEEVLRRLELSPDQIVHVAESRYHDVAPAVGLGFRTVWVNRAAGPGPVAASASGPSDAIADAEVPDLTALARAVAG